MPKTKKSLRLKFRPFLGRFDVEDQKQKIRRIVGEYHKKGFRQKIESFRRFVAAHLSLKKGPGPGDNKKSRAG